MNTLYFKAVPVEERLPAYAMIMPVLLDGRIPMMAQLRPSELPGFEKGDWFTLGMANATRIEEKKKCVTHWLEPVKQDEDPNSLQKLHKALSLLISDEDLTDDKLREASEGLLPNLHDAMLSIVYPGLSNKEEPEREMRPGATNKMWKAFDPDGVFCLFDKLPDALDFVKTNFEELPEEDQQGYTGEVYPVWYTDKEMEEMPEYQP